MRLKRCARIFVVACIAVGPALAYAETITFKTFPNGEPIPEFTQASDQFASLGVIFDQLFPEHQPLISPALDGVLFSGGPSGAFDDLGIRFLQPVSSVTIGIIGSGLNIAARVAGFGPGGNTLGLASHLYTGSTGQLSTFTFEAPPGEGIARLLYNGGVNPSAAASIGSLEFEFSSAPIPEPATLILVLASGGVALRQRHRGRSVRDPRSASATRITTTQGDC